MIHFIIILFGLTMIYVAITVRIESYIKALAAQGVLLFLLVLLDYGTTHLPNLIFLSFETLVVKAIAIPLFLVYIIRKNGIFREVEPSVTNYSSLVITTAIFAAGFFIANWSEGAVTNVRPFYFGISISTIVTGLFIIVSRKKIITHVMGYMMFENGIFLLALSMAKEMPFIVAIGVLLDIFVAVYLMGLFINKVQDSYSDTHIDALAKLKD
jgi:hydrogenase-4 component E